MTQLGGTRWPVDNVRGTMDPGSGEVGLELVSGSRAYGMVLDRQHSEALPPNVSPSPLDVAMIDRIDPTAPWSEGNVAVTSVNDLLDDAGLDLPRTRDLGDLGDLSTLDYDLAGFGPGLTVPGFTMSDTAVTINGSFSHMIGDSSDPAWGESNQYIDLTWLRLDIDGTEVAGGAVVGYLDESVGNPLLRQTFESVVGGSVHPITGSMTARIGVSTIGPHVDDLVLRFESDAPVATAGIQAVQITPGGDTAVVVHPVGPDHQVAVLDRADRDAPWAVVRTFPVDLGDDPRADVPVAIGRDGDLRFVAIADGDVVTVREWTPAGGWAVGATIELSAQVGSLALDYWSEHLAVGQPGIGRVTVYERPGWSSDWSHQVDLDGPAAFGAQLVYDWRLLTVGDPGQLLVRVYRDTGHRPWSTYGDWAQTHPGQASTELLSGTGGDPIRFRTVATAVDLGEAFVGLPTHVG